MAKGSYETLGIVGGEYFPVCSGKAMGGGGGIINSLEQ